MRRLANPSVTFKIALAAAIDGVADTTAQNNYRSQITEPTAEAIEATYKTSAQAASLHKLHRFASGANDVLVQGTLRKSDLVKLYTQYFVPADKPARRLYDQIKLTANNKCPLCGDIGHVRTLDHYLPKTSFPLYSVMPSNLIPCCRDCNSDKSDNFPERRSRQTLHPYFDDDKFFNQKWVAARVIPNAPPVVEYYVLPPTGWSALEKSRVTAHFVEYRLARRFGVEAGADLPETIVTRRTTLRCYSATDYAEYLREKSNNLNLPVNNWRRVMFACLAEDAWFCQHFH